MKWVNHFDLDYKLKKIDEFEKEMQSDRFWDDLENSQKVMKALKATKAPVEEYEKIMSLFEDVETLIQMGYEENNTSLVEECKQSLNEFIRCFDGLRIMTLLSGPYDKNNAILTLHSGAGGTEACDWVNMLYRMYSKWADQRGFSIEVLDFLDGEEVGLKSITLQVNGENAFGYLSSEKGVHRLVRISPFDSSGRRHTTFAACDVMPELNDDVFVEINEEDLKVDTYRSSGAGGQHVNTTDSAIRITHIPTGIVVQCQNERSQHKNRDRAMKMLKAKLFEVKQQEQMGKVDNIRGEVKDNSWGSQIRSYVMQPYSMVKDHRTSEETGNVNAVMDGAIDQFINAYLKWKSINHTKE
jgi:peptide chain release factor 2